MVICSLEHAYSVLYRYREGDELERFICRDEKNPSDMVYTLLRIFFQAEIRWLLEQNLLWREISGNFVDYKESFLWKGTLVIVFVRREGMPLAQWLFKQSVPLSRRLELGKKLLERLLLLNMPEYLLASILNTDCILVTEADEIVIRYEPKTIRWEEEEFSSILSDSFYKVFAQLFLKEEEEESSIEIHSYLERIRQEPYQDSFRIFQDYDCLLEDLRGYKDIDQLRPNHWRYRMQRLGIHLVQLGKKLVVPIMVAMGMAGIIYLVCHPAQEKAEKREIEQIGTLQIRR